MAKNIKNDFGDENTVTTAAEEKSKRKTFVISDDVFVKVQSCFNGKIYYKNPVSGENIVWDNIGDVQTVSMRELRAMKSRNVGFFKNQWIIILGVADGEECEATPADIYKALIVGQYYNNFIDPSNFNEICGWDEKKIAERIPLLTSSAKENLVVALNGYIKSGQLDSIKKIRAFERALGCELAVFG